MSLTKIAWVSIVLNIITAILATAILVMLLIGNAEPVKGEDEVDVVCDCTCPVEEPTEPTEITEPTEEVTEPTEPTVVTEPVEPTEEPTEVIEVTEPDNYYLGEFKLTAYCPCSSCCGQWADGITATGTTAKAGRTIAVDPSVIPYGSEVIINGHTYVAEDCGGAIKGNRIDIYFDSHSEALEFGIQYADVYIVGE